MHVLPVLVRGVLDDRPPLQEWSLFLSEYESIARLPDGGLNNVPNPYAATAFAIELQGNSLLLRIVTGGQHRERLA